MSDTHANDPVRQELLEIFVGRATRRYGLSAINQLQHALQAAALAEADAAPPATVLASLLHDVGHMIHHLGEDPAARGVDDVHEELGARWLAERFGPAVSEPVRLHVAAKRYLCTVESDYFGKLAPDSVRSLELQGGLMSPDEIAAFRANPFHAEAVRLRRYDEEAKDPQAQTPDFDHYLRHVAACRN
jgi:phosphonate degradation associated HDIG domain protein